MIEKIKSLNFYWIVTRKTVNVKIHNLDYQLN